ncbi:hypothetical protein RvY_16134 [Ramazzottius varieornatus]|uniref:DNA-directed DNA polymerase n=1 Tax=Ramazzottius varieornatus TaxID=947166 RepID=A0A1D1VXD9_RAMVA|nr:hypothetical protein RvY_16134 [Ramazzottius varieornatus]
MARQRYLEGRHYKVVTCWEYQFKQEAREDEELPDFLKEFVPMEPLHPRDAFFGGRTNANANRWCSPEIEAATAHGYTVRKIHEVYHWADSKDELFRPYIDLFYKIKTEASGYPDDCETLQRLFVEHEGIQFDRDNIKLNPGLRALAKLCLNSFWGRFSMPENRGNTEFLTDPGKFWQRVLSGESKVSSWDLINDDTVQVKYKAAEGFEDQNGTVNVVIAAFSTCYTRLHLLRYMD